MSSASFRAKRNGVSAPKNGLTRNVRLIVPADVQTIALGLPETDARLALLVHEDGRPKGALIKTTRRRNAEEADGIGEALRREWKAVFASLRAEHKPGGVSQARERIDAWRTEEVATALGFDVEISLLEYKARAEALASPAAGVEHGGLVWAERYFGERPEASRGPAMPPETFMLLDRLQVIETSPEAWRDIDGFDTVLNAVLGARWAATTRTIVRPYFAKAWMEVVRAQEQERRYAATLLELAHRPDIVVPRHPTHVPRPGDKRLDELLAAYLAAKGENKDYRAPMRALKEFFGEKKPIRAIGRQDARAFLAFIQTVPSNATKKFPGKTLAEAAEARIKTGDPAVSVTTVRTYMNHVSMIWNWALAENEAWLDKNPFEGLMPQAAPKVQREGFTDEELIKLFAALAPHKAEDHSLFWVTALSLNGARISELLQLRTHEVREHDGVHFLDFGEFDDQGLRIGQAQYKNQRSIRPAPIHPLVIEAGFLNLVERRKAAGEAQLFPKVKPRVVGQKVDWSHYHSKRINKIIDDHVSDAPKLVAHSFRHMLRERALDLDISPEIIDAIGGWAPKTVAAKYGVKRIGMLHRNLARIKFGALKL
ncbi:site-specific integrase [Brevundimonas vitis]|uniref:Site-specific integrase n=1 Tax=Brevundimonas vitisensis TaxID=2800818 RepID=A0ABX7BRH3_9CAUL|nr:site-specific integrase [Brevundimonas vitisensis]QQQ19333.1 site-specific integrase [Brevundimonas vitisensis]